MGLKTVAIATCDLCRKETQSDDASMPKGWLRISIPDYHEDRLWHERYICDRCKDLIMVAGDFIVKNR